MTPGRCASAYLHFFEPGLPLHEFEQHCALVEQLEPEGPHGCGQSPSTGHVQPALQHPSVAPPTLHDSGTCEHTVAVHASVVHALPSLQSAADWHPPPPVPRRPQISSHTRVIGTPRFGQVAQWCRATTLWLEVATTGEPDDPPSVSHEYPTSR